MANVAHNLKPNNKQNKMCCNFHKQSSNVTFLESFLQGAVGLTFMEEVLHFRALQCSVSFVLCNGLQEKGVSG